MYIFSFVDVKERALNLLKKINTKGKQLSQKEFYHQMFVLYLKSTYACRHDYFFNDEKTLSLYKNIQIIRVDLYCDGNYPRDGWKSQCMNYGQKIDDNDELTKYTLSLKKNQFIKKISGIQGKVLQLITITSTDGRQITAGTSRDGQYFSMEVPNNCIPFTFQGCYNNGFPFPSLITLSLKVKKKDGGDPYLLENYNNINLNPSSIPSYHKHFDPIQEHHSDFVRLKSIEILTSKSDTSTQTQIQGDSNNFIQALAQKKKQQKSVDIIKGIRLIYEIKLLEGRKISPYEARNNPDTKPTIQIAEREDEHLFFNSPDTQYLESHMIDLSNSDEFITRVQGIECTYISRLDITTNFGRKFSIGNDEPNFYQDLDVKRNNLPSSMVLQPKHFELGMPKGSRVVCLVGSYNQNLLSLQAHYQ